MKAFAVLLACSTGATACEHGAQSFTLAHTWEAAGTTVSVAAWASDSAALRRAVEQVRDSMQRFDSGRSRDDVRRAWAATREELRLQPDWGDVADSYALDQAVVTLAAIADSALFDLGGMFLWIGPPTARPVGIAHPDNALDPVAQVELRTGALSTVAGMHRSVTVLASGAFQASSWASALFPLRCVSALALAQGHVSAICADSTGVRWTPDLENRVQLARTGRGP